MTPSKTGEKIVAKTDDTNHTSVETEKVKSPTEIRQSNAKKNIEPGNAAPQAFSGTAQTLKKDRIKPKEPYVNIRSEPSAKSRSIAVLMGGHFIEVLETQDSWVKISWHRGDAVKQGWMKKRFIEGNE